MARYEHRDLIGTSAAGTLRLSVDEHGLLYEVEPPRSRSDVVELVERGDVRHSSFAFRTIEDAWSVTPQNYPLRTLLKVHLVDVAPVVDPAYLDTSAGLRSLADHAGASVEEVRELANANRLRELLPSAPRRRSGQEALAQLNAQTPPATPGAKALASVLARMEKAA